MQESAVKKFGILSLIKALLFLTHDKKRSYIFWTLTLLLAQLYAVVPIFIIGKVVDFFTDYTTGESLTTFYTYLIILTVGAAVISLIRVSAKQKLGNIRSDSAYYARVIGFKKLMNSSLAWHDEEAAGNKVQRINTGVEQLSSLSQLLMNSVFNAIATFVGVIIVFLFLHPPYVIFFVVYSAIFLIGLKIFYKKINRLNELLNKAREEASGTYTEGLSNVLTIKSSGAEESFNTLISEKEGGHKNIEYARQSASSNMWLIFHIYNALAYGTFLFLAGFDVVAGVISVGSIVIFYGYITQLIGSSNMILSVYGNLVQAKVGIGRMMEMIWNEAPNKNGVTKFPPSWDFIELKNIYFHYNSDNASKSPDLKDLTLSVPRHSKIGIVGKTGCGKSTLTKVLMGLYTQSEGSYKIGNTDFSEITQEEVAQNMSVVLQDSEMFNFSLRDNITLMQDVSAETFKKAILVSQLVDVIEKLPDGIDTTLGEKGYHLSGGERQRIGIARAICKEPQIIIFDEATSSLDTRTERLIQIAIEKELEDTTIIFIAHRIDTLKNTDIVYVLDKGTVAEQGTFNELHKKGKSLFSQLYKSHKK